MYDVDQDRALLARIRAGDKDACDECIRVHAPGVYRVGLRLMRNDAEAEDVMQETFLNAFKAIDTFDGRASIRTWLYRIAYNAAMMQLRKRRTHLISLDQDEEMLDRSAVPTVFFDWSSLPSRELESAEIREQLEGAIGDLPPKLRSVFVLREVEQLSTFETAAALQVSEETVKTRLHRARLWLRERLSTYFACRGSATEEAK